MKLFKFAGLICGEANVLIINISSILKNKIQEVDEDTFHISKSLIMGGGGDIVAKSSIGAGVRSMFPFQ